MLCLHSYTNYKRRKQTDENHNNHQQRLSIPYLVDFKLKAIDI